MSELRFPGEFDALERQLTHLAEDVTFPPTPVFTIPVATITILPTTHRRRMHWLLAGLAAALILIATTLAIPDSRHAVADWFGFPGIRIEIGDREGDPGPTVTSIGGSLLLGQETTLEAAQAEVAFPVLVPAFGVDGAVPEVYLNRIEEAPVVSLLYPASTELPEIGSTGVGLLLMQIDASGDTSIMIVKRASGETAPLPVTINGNSGLWIQGGMLMTDAGDPFWTYQRRSGNVLVWEQDGITYRMESNLPLSEAIVIAESLEPANVPIP